MKNTNPPTTNKQKKKIVYQINNNLILSQSKIMLYFFNHSFSCVWGETDKTNVETIFPEINFSFHTSQKISPLTKTLQIVEKPTKCVDHKT